MIVDVIHFEKRGGAFASGGSEHGRVGERVALAVHEFARRADGFGANAKNGGLAGRANPEMALIEQKIDAVFFKLDGKGRGVGNFLDDLDFGDAHFEAAGGALLGADFSSDDDAGFLRETFQRFKGFGIFLERADALDDSRTVAKNREHQFAGFAEIVEPAANRYFLPVVLACLFDSDDSHGQLFE